MGAALGAHYPERQNAENIMKQRFEILPSVPAYGPGPERFSASGNGPYGEAVAIRFLSSNDKEWAGVFEGGLGDTETALAHPDGKRIIVIASGQGYLVDSDDPEYREYFGGAINTILPIQSLDSIAFGSNIDFVLISTDSVWYSPRVSWDGIRKTNLLGEILQGEAWDYTDQWVPFEINFASREVSGGSYREPSAF